MLVRNECKCLSCDGQFILRYGVGLSKIQKMIFSCPYCETILRANLSLDYKNINGKFDSDDIEVFNNENHTDLGKAITVYTDIPVNKEIQGKSLSEGGSAFLALHNYIGDRFEDYNTRKEILHNFNTEILPHVRRAETFYLEKKFGYLKKELIKAKVLKKSKKVSQKDISNIFHFLLINIGIALDRENILSSAINKTNSCLEELGKSKGAPLKELLSLQFSRPTFNYTSKRLFRLYSNILDKFDAMNLGLIVEYFSEGNVELDDFEIFRDDFNELKTLYVDTYELCLSYLSYIIPFYNLLARDSYNSWSDGKQRNLDSFDNLNSHGKEFSFAEINELNAIYSLLGRNLRNKIGHYDIMFDFKKQLITTSAGDIISIFEFIKLFKDACICLTYLLFIDSVISTPFT